jgi:hypothetical protein
MSPVQICDRYTYSYLQVPNLLPSSQAANRLSFLLPTVNKNGAEQEVEGGSLADSDGGEAFPSAWQQEAASSPW